MRNYFDRQLGTLHVELIKMGSLCEEAITLSTQALNEKDRTLREKVFLTDSEIDQKEREIEDLCMRLLLQQQPVAGDLRTVSAAMKMISDMERIGDQAADIAELSRYIVPYESKNKKTLLKMAEAAVHMVTESVNAFVKNDQDLAQKVIGDDDAVDQLFEDVNKELMNQIQAGEVDAGLSLDLLMVAKYLERIADHAVNIAEWVIYSITGVHISNEHRFL